MERVPNSTARGVLAFLGVVAAARDARQAPRFAQDTTCIRSALAAVALLSLACFSQTPTARPPMTSEDAIKLLSFEGEHTGGLPRGWSGGPAGTFAIDAKVVHRGKWSVRLERNSASQRRASTITKSIPIDFTGQQLELRGFLRTENVTGYVGLWMREDGDQPMLAVDDMRRQELKGTTGWNEYSIVLPLHEEARQLVFGVALTGTGEAWADDLQLLVDGKPFWEARRRPETALARDHEFDGGSKITISEMTPGQIEGLAILAKVWGFLKYHHPRVTGGEVHHDYELFRIMPSVLSAANGAAAREAIYKWVAGLGRIEPCTRCTTVRTDNLHLQPRVAWLSDTQALSVELSDTLIAIHRNRPQLEKQFYVSNAGAGNAVFNHEPSYANIKLPDTGFQLLSLFRFWNMIQYWFPYRDIIGANWETVLTEFIPRIGLARTRETYQLEMMAFIARVNDTHANLWSSLSNRPPGGPCQVPVKLRFIGKRAVVSGYADGLEDTLDLPLERGDVIESVDGVPVPELVAQWGPYYAASNEPARLRDMAEAMLRGKCVDASLHLSRGISRLEVKVPRMAQSSFKISRWHDLPGEPFRKLSPDIGYLKLSSAKEENIRRYIEDAAGTKGLVIDLRNYPSAATAPARLALHLVDKRTPFARFTIPDLANPGAFGWTEPTVLQPSKPHYEGMVVILVDEVSQSAAEFSAMAFRVSPRAKIVGSTTAGADGNTSTIPLPGGLRSMISGIGVFYPDKRPTQRIGIVPDIEVRPTVEGIRAGRDEVLERALRLILGDGVTAAEIEKMTQH